MHRSVLIGSLLLPLTVAHATNLFSNSSFSSGLFSSTPFNSDGSLTLIGSAALSGNQVDLTNANVSGGGFQSGSLYTSSTVTLGANDAFSTSFQFQFTNPGGGGSSPGDGISFILFMPPGTPHQGFNGGALGYYQNNAQQTVGIEFDTADNEPVDQGSSNHVATLVGGAINDTNLTNVYGISSCVFAGNSYLAAGCMSNGDVWTVNISYDGSLLTVTLLDPAKGISTTPLNGVPFDIPGGLCASWPSFDGPCPNTVVYAGITGATGGDYQTESILNWSLSDAPTTNSSATPEPSSILLLASGLLLALGYWTVTARRMAR